MPKFQFPVKNQSLIFYIINLSSYEDLEKKLVEYPNK
jgi:hypothetical protein